MNYELVYDAANQNLVEWDFISTGILFSIIGAILVFSPRIRLFLARRASKKFSLIFSWSIFGFALLWTLLASSATFFDNKESKIISIENTCISIEGVVDNFNPMPYEGHQLETFEVEGVKFGYSDFVLNGGFNNTASHGGPISDGLRVKICYLHRKRTQSNVIVRLEIASEK